MVVLNLQYQDNVILICICMVNILYNYGKTFEWENFRGFHDLSLNREFVPMIFLPTFYYCVRVTDIFLDILC